MYTGVDLTAADRTGSTVAAAFADAVESGRLNLPLPGGGRTRERWAVLAVLADLAGEDLSLARLAEGHADALAICSEVMQRVGRALGAGPLCHDQAHTRRVADLTVYLRQHHAERNLAELGALVADSGAWW
jgi:hypothetical protein